ncbi:MAG: PhoX family protein [Gammaproteobacteria bacterium]
MPQDHSPPEHEARTSPQDRPDLAEVVSTRLSRRQLLASAAGLGVASMLVSCSSSDANATTSLFGFSEPGWLPDGHLHLPPGYQANVLLRWGDPITNPQALFNPEYQTGLIQQQQFGYNCDFTAFMPFSRNSQDSDRGLLVVNHEFTIAPLMYSGSPLPSQLTPNQLRAEMAAQGASVVEIYRDRSGWQYNPTSGYNRRITPHTPMRFDGPAAGHERLQLNRRDGMHTNGTWNNCGGGVTPWGTVLLAEENFNFYFKGQPSAGPEAENHARYGVTGEAFFNWYKAEERWNLNLDPSYPLHAGWIVEFDPYNPEDMPVKHTALGRMKHEGCTLTLSHKGHVVAYMADDQEFEYLYRFISRYPMTSAAAQQKLVLSEGELSVASFNADGQLLWRPLIYGQGPITPANGFHSQGDVMLNTRRAADLMGATPLDRPEGIAINPQTNRIYCSMTSNKSRTQPHAASPRANNPYGHILELIPGPDGHHSETFTWEIFLLAGRNDEEAGFQHPASTEGSYFVNPDNLVCDAGGNLWIATDGAPDFGLADTLMVCGLSGDKRRYASRFLTAPAGAEVTGTSFTPDGSTLFLSIQHPGASRTSHFHQPLNRWPDFHPDLPPRPSVIAVHRTDGGTLLR